MDEYFNRSYKSFKNDVLLRDKKISFDVDGVKVDTTNLALKLYNKRFKENKKKSDLKDFYIIKSWIKNIINDDKIAMNESIKIWNDEKVLSLSKPVSGAADLSRFLSEMNLKNVFYITSRPGYTKPITYNWFNKWLPWVRKSSIHISNTRNGLQSEFKVQRIRDLGINIHFEDSIEQAEKIASTIPDIKIVLVRQPWNWHITQNDVSKSIIVPGKVRNKPKMVSAYEALLKSF